MSRMVIDIISLFSKGLLIHIRPETPLFICLYSKTYYKSTLDRLVCKIYNFKRSCMPAKIAEAAYYH
jgi:hypothetical protein